MKNFIYSRQSVEIETQMTSVERVLEYCVLDQEPPSQSSSKHRPPTNWPSHGRVVFNNVCMSHSKDPNVPLALNHISLTIQAGEKDRYCWKNRCWQKFIHSNTFSNGYTC